MKLRQCGATTVLNRGIRAAKSDEELEGIKLGKDIPKLILNYYKNISQCNSNQYIARPTVRLENENKKRTEWALRILEHKIHYFLETR